MRSFWSFVLALVVISLSAIVVQRNDIIAERNLEIDRLKHQEFGSR